jgi:hypothetical protein
LPTSFVKTDEKGDNELSMVCICIKLGDGASHSKPTKKWKDILRLIPPAIVDAGVKTLQGKSCTIHGSGWHGEKRYR